MFRIIYAEKRKAGMTRLQFIRRWRLHAGRAMEASDFWDPMTLYIQNDALPQADDIAGIDADYDGVGELYYPTLDACKASLAAPSLPAIIADGDEFFSRRDVIHMVTDHQPVVDGRPGAFVLFLFLHGCSSDTHGGTVNQVVRRIRALASTQETFRQASLGLAVQPAHGHDGVIQFSFDTRNEAHASISAWRADLDAHGIRPGLDAMTPVTILTRACTMYDTRDQE